jgi:hypothetical protein
MRIDFAQFWDFLMPFRSAIEELNNRRRNSNMEVIQSRVEYSVSNVMQLGSSGRKKNSLRIVTAFLTA